MGSGKTAVNKIIAFAVVGMSLKKFSYQSKPSLCLPTNDRSAGHYTFSVSQIHPVLDYNASPVGENTQQGLSGY